ncbi:MAG: DUF86 domain-containing protein [Armatimonadota bacterium]
MPRDCRLQIEDILTAIARIRAYVQGMNYDAFAADEKTQDAVVRNLEVIGEAARVLPEEVKAETSSVDWRKVVGLRNVLIHEYFGISLPIIWDILINKLDELEAECRRMLGDLQ